ncbi:MAG TPA: MscL family protein [Miltoncostaeaceae bacterium]|nr:MscL family protein [Miltoncostaeaceae bacterium]
MTTAVKDFKGFVLKGDVVALAVAVIVATAFGAVIAASSPASSLR